MTTPTGAILFGGLIAWSIYRRVRRNVGRQRLRPRRIIVSIVLLAVASCLILAMTLHIPKLLLGIATGLLLGVALGFAGLRLTKFETNAEGHFYTPNTWIGVTLSVLLAGRILYRYWMTSNAMLAPGQPPKFQSALTLLLSGLILGYYLVYYIGLFVHTRDKALPSV